MIFTGLTSFSDIFTFDFQSNFLLGCVQMWIAKAEYDESGPSIVHRKCF